MLHFSKCVLLFSLSVVGDFHKRESENRVEALSKFSVWDIFRTNAHIIIFERRYSEGNTNYMFASFIGDVLAYISTKKECPNFPKLGHPN